MAHCTTFNKKTALNMGVEFDGDILITTSGQRIELTPVPGVGADMVETKSSSRTINGLVRDELDLAGVYYH